VLIYARGTEADRVVVALNFSARAQPLPAVLVGAQVLMSTHRDRTGALEATPLRPDEGLVLKP
jgi:hypothetical protein